jgi:non-specific serine/threonine protein kinase
MGQRLLALARAQVALEEGAYTLALEIVESRLAAERGPVPCLAVIRALALEALDAPQAEGALVQARDTVTAHEARPLLWRVQAAMGRLMRRQRRRAESRQAFDDARATAAELAARIPDPTLRQTFERAVREAVPDPVSPSAREKAKSASGGLTSRERDVARLVAQGKSNRAIARALGIGERTVEGYVASALAKLTFSTRAQLAAWTVESGLGAPTAKR